MAACDKELIGRTIEDKDFCVKVSESFYGSDLINEKEFVELLKKAANANLIGEKTVNLAVKLNLISEKNIIKIGSTPHVQIYKV